MKLTRHSFLRSLAITALLFSSGLLLRANTAVQPEPRDAAWLKRHESFVAIAQQGGVDVLFLGDSITDFWRSTDKTKGGKTVWDANFGALHPANFGISADRTQHVLWRIQNGELDGIQPKVIVLMIGTNNCGLERDGKTPRNATPEVIEGVTAVVNGLRAKLPDTKILLLGIFPRAQKGDPLRDQVREVNQSLAKLDDRRHVYFLDIGAKFLEPDGTLSKDVMPDLLHPNEHGYEIWAAAIKQPLADLLK